MRNPNLFMYRNLRITDSNIREAGFGLYNGPNPIENKMRITEYRGQESVHPIHGNYL